MEKETLKKIQEKQKAQLEEYKSIPSTGMKKAIMDGLWSRLCSHKNREQECENYVKEITKQFWGIMLKAANCHKYCQSYKHYGVKRDNRHFSEMDYLPDALKKVVCSWLTPLVTYYIDKSKTKINKELLKKLILCQDKYDDNCDKYKIEKISLIIGEQRVPYNNVYEDVKTLDLIAKYVDNNDYTGLSNFISEHIKKVIKEFENIQQAHQKLIELSCKLYVIKEDQTEHVAIIFNNAGDMYQITKSGNRIPLGNQLQNLKKLMELNPNAFRELHPEEW